MANGAGRAFTAEEDQIILDSRSRGDRFAVIAVRINRTAKATQNRYFTLTRDAALGNSRLINDNIRTASDELRDRIWAMFERQSSRQNIPMSEIVRKTMGSEPAQKSADSRHIHKTSSIIRHANSVMALGRAA